jgi:hypothetical protein
MNEPTERPLGLSLLTWLLWFWAGAAALVLVVLVVGEGPIPLSGRAVDRQEALARILPIVVPMALAAAGAALALALEKPWARSAVLLPVALAAVAPAFTGAATSLLDVFLGALALVPVVAVLVWYLYYRPRVTEYFRHLWERQRERERPRTTE